MTAVSLLGSPQPNPFDLRSSLAFAIERSGCVQLRIYDLSGRTVRELIDGPLGTGRHGATWDGRDASGARMRSGTYFYRLLLDGQSVGAAKTVFLGR